MNNNLYENQPVNNAEVASGAQEETKAKLEPLDVLPADCTEKAAPNSRQETQGGASKGQEPSNSFERPPSPPPPPPSPVGIAPPPGGVPPHWQGRASASPPPRPPSIWRTLLIVLAVLLMFGVLFAFFAMFVSIFQPAPAIVGEHVGVIEIEGVIRDGGEGGLFLGPAGARGIMRQIRQAAKDNNTKAVVVLINSPGGSAAAAHAIYQEIMRLRQKKKVVACLTDMAASGGYYVASACDKIVAEGSTLTGSIGVIFGNIGYYGLMKKLGLTNETITAGKYKDMGSGARPMTAEERMLIAGMLQDVYEQFLRAVAEGRRMDIAKVRELAQGRIYTGAQAKAAGLVDELGNFYDAVALAGKLGGIQGEPKLRYFGQPRGLFSELFGAESLLRNRGWGELYRNMLPVPGPMLLWPYAYRLEPLLPIME